MRKVYEALYCSGKYFTMEDIFCFLNTHPEIRGLNRKYQTSSMGYQDLADLTCRDTA